MDREVAPELPRRPADAAAAQQVRRQQRAAGDDRVLAAHAQRPPALGAGHHLAHAAAADVEPRDARAGVRRRPGIPGARDIGDADVLLGSRRAAERTDARADAALGVAVQEVAAEAQRVGTLLDEERVAPRDLRGHLADVDRLLDTAEERVERLRRERLEPELLAPAGQDAGRRAEA